MHTINGARIFEFLCITPLAFDSHQSGVQQLL